MRIGKALSERYWRAVSGLLAAVVVVGNPLLHKRISDVCDALFARIGRGPYERAMLFGIAAISLGGAGFLLRHRAAALARPRIAASLLALAAASIAAQRWLLVSNVELIHLPQFGLVAALLMAAGAGPHAAWIGGTAAGVFDETYQHLVIYAHTPGTYFDWNDIVLNAIGVSWAVVLAGDWLGPPLGPARRRVVRAILAVALGAAVWAAPPHLAARADFPYWRPALARAMTGYDYHVMSASEGALALVALWAVVVAALRPARRRDGAMLPAAAAALWLVVGSGCAGRQAPPAPTGPPPAAAADRAAPRPDEAPFIVTFWCGPPLPEFTDARAAEIAAAGFTVVGAPCEGAISPALNRRALDVAARHGLSLWIADGRVNAADDLPDDWEARLAAAAADYREYPALGGYFVVDEPSAAQFGNVGRVVERLRSLDPRRMPYVNMLPDYASPDALGTPTYREHVERYMAEVRPPLLSFDYYPFKIDADRETFFESLLLVRAAAARYRVPFLLIVQAMPHGPYRDPCEAEMAWQVNHALAFGARGISYFAYWTPTHPDRWQFRRGLVEGGRPTAHLAEAARINGAARAHAAALTGMRSLAVVDSEGRFAPPFPFGPIAAASGAPVTAGFFGSDGVLAVLLVNQDYRQPHQLELQVRSSSAPEAFDPATQRWQPLRGNRLLLAAGGARLLRWT